MKSGDVLNRDVDRVLMKRSLDEAVKSLESFDTDQYLIKFLLMIYISNIMNRVWKCWNRLETGTKFLIIDISIFETNHD